MKRIYAIIITILLTLSAIAFLIIGSYMISQADQDEIDYGVGVVVGILFLGLTIVVGFVLIIFTVVQFDWCEKMKPDCSNVDFRDLLCCDPLCCDRFARNYEV